MTSAQLGSGVFGADLTISAILVFIAGGFGALIRMKLSRKNSGHKLPLGTIYANLFGCTLIVVIHYIYVAFITGDPHISTMLATGLCGGISTLSTAAIELVAMLKHRQFARFFAYLSITVAIPIVIAFCLTIAFLFVAFFFA